MLIKNKQQQKWHQLLVYCSGFLISIDLWLWHFTWVANSVKSGKRYIIFFNKTSDLDFGLGWELGFRVLSVCFQLQFQPVVEWNPLTKTKYWVEHQIFFYFHWPRTNILLVCARHPCSRRLKKKKKLFGSRWRGSGRVRPWRSLPTCLPFKTLRDTILLIPVNGQDEWKIVA